MKTVTYSLFMIFHLRATFVLALALGGFALVQKAQAVNQPPDGRYAGGNTAEEQGARLNLSSGTFNTAVGLLSLKSNTQGKFKRLA
jgi:hypothetical protein